MFWRFGNYANISTLDTILDKPDLTVEELLDESDLIQELKQQNTKLIEYLRDGNVLERLLRYVIAPKEASSPEEEHDREQKESGRDNPREGFFQRVRGKSRSQSMSKSDESDDGESKEDKQRMKYAYVACEILSCEIYSISQALVEDNQDALRTFWQYVKQPPQLDPVQAGYFTKVNEALLDRDTGQMLNFLKSIDNVVSDMLQHVDCPMIMDLLLKIISLEKNEGGEGIVDWLQSQNLVPILLSYLSPDHTASVQTSAGDFLKAIITISANATTQDQSVIGPNELTRQLVSDVCIKQMITEMLHGGNPLTVGVGIVIEVIRKNNSDYDLENQTGPVPKSSDPIYLGTLLRQFANHIPNFMDLVHNSNKITTVNSDGTKTVKKREIKAAFGEKIEPLGFDRFKTCELMAELLHCSNMALLNERGAESEIKRRDSDRERLKTEGKLQPARSPTVNDFSTSVDSHGFHHARAPSSESPEEIRKLEVQNNTEEEEFEKVTSSEAVSEEMKDFNDRGNDDDSKTTSSSDSSSSTDKASSPEEGASTPTPATGVNPQEAESPTAAGLSAKVGGLELESGKTEEDASSKGQPTSLLTQQLNEEGDADSGVGSPHLEDKPAPLFSGSRDASSTKTKEKPSLDILSPTIPESETSEVTPIEDASSAKSIMLSEQASAYAPTYEVDVDGSPVVGDLLKIKFVENKVVPTILDFFFRFPWNNFLHNVVYDVVQQVFNGQMERGYNRSLAIDLFETGRITERIFEGQEASDKAQSETNMRLGYMGHLTLIAEEVLKFTERHPAELLSQTVLDKVMSQAWNDYVEHTLAETRERDNAILGGVRPDMSVGPRQAVLNAVNAASGFSSNNASLASAGLSSAGAIGLDTMDLGNSGTTGGYGFSGGSLSSGFNNSSDEEDEEMEEGESNEARERSIIQLSDSDQIVRSPDPADPLRPSSSVLDASPESASAVPAPLAVPPTRARRQFAARLAERKAMLEKERGEKDDDDDDDEDEDEEGEVGDEKFKKDFEGEKETTSIQKGGPQRFSGLFIGGGDEDDDSEEDSSDEDKQQKKEA